MHPQKNSNMRSCTLSRFRASEWILFSRKYGMFRSPWRYFFEIKRKKRNGKKPTSNAFSSSETLPPWVPWWSVHPHNAKLKLPTIWTRREWRLHWSRWRWRGAGRMLLSSCRIDFWGLEHKERDEARWNRVGTWDRGGGGVAQMWDHIASCNEMASSEIRNSIRAFFSGFVSLGFLFYTRNFRIILLIRLFGRWKE